LECDVKIALVQINPVIGDFAYNSAKIVEWAEKAAGLGCQLVIFPELAVTGYPPQDLLLRPQFIRDQLAAIDQMVAQLPPIDVLFGAVLPREQGRGKPLFNSAILAREGNIVFTSNKRLLPSYDVFDETRYFEPGKESGILESGGRFFGVTVCEDAWSGDIPDYNHDPIADLVQSAKERGLSLSGVINVSASPFQKDKPSLRQIIFKKICLNHGLCFLYANQVGGQDSLLFDGSSFALNGKGEILARAKAFAEDMVIVDLLTSQGSGKAEILEEEQAVYQGLVMGVRDYARKCRFTAAVIGLSGGIDSALTAAIAVDALGADQVLGVAMPSRYSSDHSLEDAEQLSKSLGCAFEIIAIEDIFQSFNRTLAPLFEGWPGDLTEQNLQARIRGNLLMALSNKFGHLLLTTGNKSEMAVGYCTLYGDMSGGLAVISDLPKQYVYRLAELVNSDFERIPWNILRKPPSAELKPEQTDQDDLPTYDLLDKILELHLEERLGLAEIIGKGFDEAVVQDILNRVRINEYKRKQAPLGLKVTTKAFGIGRRFPNVQNYQS
jgi:NAD+ synthetase